MFAFQTSVRDTHRRWRWGRVTSLPNAIAELVRDGDTVALEGFTHLIPFAAGPRDHPAGSARSHARPDDPRPRLRPDDRRGLRRASSSSRGAATPASARCTGSATRSQHGWPVPLEIEEHSHAGHGQPVRRRRVRACRSRCCAATSGTDLPAAHRRRSQPITCPFTGEELTAVPALNPDVGDRARPARRPRTATSSSGASPACRRRPCSRSRRSLVTVEEIVDELDAACPARWCCRTGWSTPSRSSPAGPHPSYAHGLLRPRQRLSTGRGTRSAGPGRRSRDWLRDLSVEQGRAAAMSEQAP